eukprot:714814-Alexandrium_andersonii.AAC.1
MSLSRGHKHKATDMHTDIRLLRPPEMAEIGVRVVQPLEVCACDRTCLPETTRPLQSHGFRQHWRYKHMLSCGRVCWARSRNLVRRTCIVRSEHV